MNQRGKTILQVEIPQTSQFLPTHFAAPVEGFTALSEIAFVPGVGRLLRIREEPRVISQSESPDGIVCITGQGTVLEATFSLDNRPVGSDLFGAVANIYAKNTGSSLSANHFRIVECQCPAIGCNELGLPRIVTHFNLNYASLDARILHRYPNFFDLDQGQTGKLIPIIKAIGVVDPLGLSEFDIRINRASATHYGCVEVLEHQVREAPYGAEHLPAQELKTLCYLVTPTKGESTGPFIVMINTMASEKISMRAVKDALQAAGRGRKFNIEPANISEKFGIEKGEVHPLSLVPFVGDDLSIPVVHLYDQCLKDARYVTTNGGHPDWTTEFRSDTFVAAMQSYYNSGDGSPLVICAAISEAQETVDGQTSVLNTSRREWIEERVEISRDDALPPADLRERKFATYLMTGDATTIFIDELKSAAQREFIAIANGEEVEITNLSLHVLRQSGLDFEVVKFPQCWRPLFEEIAKALAQIVRQGGGVLFVDCNVTPVEQIFADQMPESVRSFFVERLRVHLADLYSDDNDTELLQILTKRVQLMSKPVILTEFIRRIAMREGHLDLFVVGGAQVSDPGLSKYHDGLMSISDCVTVHVLDAQQVVSAKRAMYYAETGEREMGLMQALELYQIIDSMWGSVENSENPVIVLASTSLCQAHYSNGEQIVPDHAVDFIASKMNITPAEVRLRQEQLSKMRIVNSSLVYAQASAAYLANRTSLYDESAV